METQRNLLESAAHLQNLLRQAGIDSMAVGGLAIAAWGEPRATKDADLKVLLQPGFDLQAMKRQRQIEPLPGISLTVCSPEDLIIYKMISTRARDQEDARGVIRLQRETLDHEYVEDWLQQFELALDDSTLVQSYRQMRQTD